MINVRYLSAKLIFEQQAQAEKEIQKRAWLYLRAIGYRIYSEYEITVSCEERNTVSMVRISGSYHCDHHTCDVDIEVPLMQFEMVAPADDNPNID